MRKCDAKHCPRHPFHIHIVQTVYETELCRAFRTAIDFEAIEAKKYMLTHHKVPLIALFWRASHAKQPPPTEK
jgi:hypothetical protein